MKLFVKIEKTNIKKKLISEFSQFDINQDLLKYEQDIDLIEDDVTLSDNVLFSVDVLGIGAHLDNLNLTIHIIPKLIPFRSFLISDLHQLT